MNRNRNHSSRRSTKVVKVDLPKARRELDRAIAEIHAAAGKDIVTIKELRAALHEVPDPHGTCPTLAFQGGRIVLRAWDVLREELEYHLP